MVKLSDDKVKLLDEFQARSEPMIGALLTRLVQEIGDEIQEALAGAGFEDIRTAHNVVFQHLRPEGSRVTEIAERARLTKQAAQYLVDHLEGGGYLERFLDPEDGRAKLLRLTDRGREVERIAREAIAGLENRWAARVGREDFSQFFAVLHVLYRDAQEHGAKGQRVR